MSINYTAISSERKTDPATLGYNGDDAHDLAILNGADPVAAQVARSSIGKNDFLRLTLAASVRCKTLVAIDSTALTQQIADKWYEVIQQARAADPGSTIDLTLVSLIGDPVTDKIMTQPESDALLKRHKSRAEALGIVGAEQLLTLDDLARSH